MQFVKNPKLSVPAIVSPANFAHKANQTVEPFCLNHFGHKHTSETFHP